ncbi:MAG TPA: Hsp20/alpha crystallin family protein [Acidimicrobiales bacterium]|jgi:HSP20 family protein|nr:Hsp20/alpha crystallin family protein [Acidimicrobiales bacterium]
MMLARFEPLRDLDRLTQQLWGQGSVRAASVPMDAYRQGDRFVAHFDLPGIDPASIDLTVEKNVLTVRADRAAPAADDGREWLVTERPQGSFTRQLFLGDGLDADRVEAEYDRGVLSITIPVAEQAKPRRIDVTSGSHDQPAVRAAS